MKAVINPNVIFVSGAIILLVALWLGVIPSASLVSPAMSIGIYNQKTMWSPGQYEYFASVNARCQEPPVGMGAVSYTGFVIYNTPGDLQAEKFEIIKTVTGGYGTGTVSLHEPLFGSWTGTDPVYATSSPITSWGFALPNDAATGNAQSAGCEYRYHILFKAPVVPPSAPPAAPPPVTGGGAPVGGQVPGGAPVPTEMQPFRIPFLSDLIDWFLSRFS